MHLGNRELGPSELLAMLKRRAWWIIAPIVVGPLVGLATTYLVQPRYTSEAMVLVEPQRVPDRFVTPIVTEQINSRLATIREQIMSRSRLQPIIERFGLFREDTGKIPVEEILDRMRKLIEISPIRTEAGSSGFRIAFTWRDRLLAQQVCNEIMSIFMEQSLKIREQHAEDTTEFLSRQVDDAKQKLDQQDSILAAFKTRHLGQLPTDEARNMQMLATLTSRMETLTQTIASARQQRMVQESLLAQATPNATGASVAAGSMEAQREIEALQTQLAQLRSRYTEDHPDVKKLKYQIELLKGTSQHTEVAASPSADHPVLPSPQVAQIRMAIRLIDDDIKEKTQEQARIQRGMREYESNIQITPTVEEQFKALTRDYQTALGFYNDLLAKKAQSEMATDLERRQQGEQFRVMDPPNLPEKATFPKKPAFVGGGFLLGLGIGIGLALLLELRQDFIRTEADIADHLELPLLGVVQYVSVKEKSDPRDVARRDMRQAVSG
ncbi:lipopolysaccharide biosynthesis protein [Acidobacteria bacterium AB60]|nr:lipopolysaccharide biosynthesis protein [Acidobacteria bacterium AB60]